MQIKGFYTFRLHYENQALPWQSGHGGPVAVHHGQNYGLGLCCKLGWSKQFEQTEGK